MRSELIRGLCVQFRMNLRNLRIHATGKCHVGNLPTLTGRDLFPYPLSDLAVACAVACPTDHPNCRGHLRSGLPFSASIVVAFLVLLRRKR